jgi:hypothetical protein
MNTSPHDDHVKQPSFVTIDKNHWDRNWASGFGARPLSLLNVFNRDAIALLSRPLRGTAGASVVEIGFVPGKFLQFLEHHFQAECHGYDYSESGCSNARRFLGAQRASVQVHCQDVLEAPPDASHRARLVYSIGVVEHFADPTAMIRAHLKPLAEDGVAIIILPNYQGLNLRIQTRLDPENIAIHNLDSMTTAFWERHARQFPEHEFTTRQFGRLNPWMFSLHRFGKVGHLLQLAINFASLLLPSDMKAWASMFVVEIRSR